jgi:hypothetical protein
VHRLLPEQVQQDARDRTRPKNSLAALRT